MAGQRDEPRGPDRGHGSSSRPFLPLHLAFPKASPQGSPGISMAGGQRPAVPAHSRGSCSETWPWFLVSVNWCEAECVGLLCTLWCVALIFSEMGWNGCPRCGDTDGPGLQE